MKWEYYIVAWHRTRSETELMDLLGDDGQEGWELVQVVEDVYDRDYMRYFFKRPKE